MADYHKFFRRCSLAEVPQRLQVQFGENKGEAGLLLRLQVITQLLVHWLGCWLSSVPENAQDWILPSSWIWQTWTTGDTAKVWSSWSFNSGHGGHHQDKHHLHWVHLGEQRPGSDPGNSVDQWFVRHHCQACSSLQSCGHEESSDLVPGSFSIKT